MKIAITHPTDWPHVRRGTERFINELARYLMGHGHTLTVISAKAGPRVDHTDFGYRTIQYRRLWKPWMAKLGVIEAHPFLLTSYAGLLRGGFDVIICCSFTDAYAASLVSRQTGVPYIFWVNGLPPRVKYYRSLSLGGRVFRAAIRNAAEVVSLSQFMRSYIQERYERDSTILPVPVDPEAFPLHRERDLSHPEVLCMASLTDARKGGRALVRGFDRLKDRVSKARLRIAFSIPDQLREEYLSLVRPQWHGDVFFAGTGTVEDIPKVYGRAAASVLSSKWEPFGLVVVESLCCGTPVAGTRSGALPEILDDPRVGRLFDPGPDSSIEPTDPDSMAEAMEATIELSRDPETPDRCRAHAAKYSWENIGPEFAAMCERAAAGRAASRA